MKFSVRVEKESQHWVNMARNTRSRPAGISFNIISWELKIVSVIGAGVEKLSGIVKSSSKR